MQKDRCTVHFTEQRPRIVATQVLQTATRDLDREKARFSDAPQTAHVVFVPAVGVAAGDHASGRRAAAAQAQHSL